MARRAESKAVYDAAAQWFQSALPRGGSVFLTTSWNTDNIRRLHRAFAGNPLHGDEKFEKKLEKQLAGEPTEVVLLAAEMLWVLFLYPRGSLSASRKRELILLVQNWIMAPALPGRWLSDDVLAGIGTAGTAFNTQRDREFEALIAAVLAIKTAGHHLPKLSPWKTAEIIDAIPSVSRRNIRNLLLHLIFPDEFEGIASLHRKQQIVTGFREFLAGHEVPVSSPIELDRQLLAIRRRLEELWPGRVIDYYDSDLRSIWDSPPEDSAAPRRKASVLERLKALAGTSDVGQHARAGLSLAQHLAQSAGLPESTPDLLFAAYMTLAEDQRYQSLSAVAIHQQMRHQSGKKIHPDARPFELILKRYGLLAPALSEASFPLVTPQPLTGAILTTADRVRSAVAEVSPLPLSPRHILAVLLLPGPASAAPVLAEIGFDPAGLRTALLRSASRRVGEKRSAWRRVLLELDAPSAENEAIYAGFSTDFIPSDESRRIRREDDRLGVMRDVTALAEVLAAHETKPPLAVGLFGDWGSGKSFFMELLRDEVTLLGRQNRSFYCERVVQVWFNAWHYMESNLWASLAARVFEELAAHLEKWNFPADTRIRLFEQLQESQGVLAEAVSERKVADARLKNIRSARVEKEHSFAATAATAFRTATAALSADPEIQRELREAKSRLGLTAVEADVATVAERVRQLRSWRGRIVAIGRALISRPAFLFLGVLIFAGVTFSSTWLLHHYPLFSGPSRVVATIAAWIAALAAALTPITRRVSRGVRWLDDVATRLQQRRDAEQRKEELAIHRELSRLHEREREAEERVAALTRDIEDLRAGRRLQQFIVERHTSAEYRQHLGLVNLIRKDFEQLSKLLTDAQSEPAETSGVAWEAGAPAEPDREAPVPLPRIDRIVLYIDDLDRCPEDRVVEVLQAVHLLLAFPVFVVVVGVDSRWLLLSLEDHYAALRGKAGERDENIDRSGDDWNTTPQNYLEKIFQIPFTLRPMEVTGFGSLVEALLPVSPYAYTASGTGDSNTREPHGGDGSRPQSASSMITDWEGEQENAEPEDSGHEDVNEENGEEVVDHAPPVPLPPNPQGLTVETRERDLVAKLHPLIASPRALKRFTNVYRFLRVQQRGPALDRFRGTEKEPGEFQVVALLLAAVVGHPNEATELLRRVITNRVKPWWTLVEELGCSSERNAAFSASKKSAAPAGNWGRATLREALLEVKSSTALGLHSPETFTRWAREVARFSFQSGRILSFRELEGAVTEFPESTDNEHQAPKSST